MAPVNKGTLNQNEITQIPSFLKILVQKFYSRSQKSAVNLSASRTLGAVIWPQDYMDFQTLGVSILSTFVGLIWEQIYIG